MNRRTIHARRYRRAGAVGRPPYTAEAADLPPKRVGLIGCGWYGKSDIFRLVQVAPVEIVSLCDVDKQDDGRLRGDGGRAPGLQKEAADVHRLPRDAQGERPRHGGDRHAGSLARPAHDRGRQGRRRPVPAKAHQRGRRGRPGDAGRGPQVQARGAGGHAAAQHSAPDRGAQPGAGGQARHHRTRGDLFLWRRPGHCRAAGARARHARLGFLDRSRADDALQPRDPAQLARSSWSIGNGTIGDMGIHMLDMVRWFMGLGWPKRISSFGGLRILTGGKSNIADTQTAMFELRQPRPSSGSIAASVPRWIRIIRGAPRCTARKAR